MGRLALEIGSMEDALRAEAVKTYAAEFISTLLFVYAGVGSAMAFDKLTEGAATTAAGLLAIALAHALALFVCVAMAANVSGGHVNPAVSWGLALGGHISVTRALFYWLAQLLGSTLACLLLGFTTGGAIKVPPHALGKGISAGQGLVMESLITFALVYTVYATAVDPRKGSVGTVAPMAIGFVVGANILAAGCFSGGSMNPARSFGPALVSGSWDSHWIYWAGPLLGASLAALVYVPFLIMSLEALPPPLLPPPPPSPPPPPPPLSSSAAYQALA